MATFKNRKFELKTPFQPTGDQPQAIADLVRSLNEGKPAQVLLGVTGSGKTFTMMGPSDNMGVNRRAIRELLSVCAASKEIQFVIKVPMTSSVLTSGFAHGGLQRKDL